MTAARAGRPNVLLILFDTARADAFEPYGAPAGASPAVRQLADLGHAYRAFAAAPWTIPSHAAMFAGLLPRAAGMPGARPDTMITASRAALPSLEHRWLPSVLRAAGYRTGGVSANGLISAATGFDLGFEEFRQIDSGYWCSWTGRLGWALQALRVRGDEGSAEVERLLGYWLAAPDRRPFFGFVNLIECHSPYMPVRPYNPLRPVGRVRAAQEWGRYLRGETHRTVFGGAGVPAGALGRMRQLYAGSVRLLDAWLARILQALDDQRLLDDTIVIVTSDHGENLGEGGLLGHAYSLDDRLIRVPFVVAGPSAPLPGPVFSQVQMPGWLARCCGLDDHPWLEPAGQDVAVAEFDPYGRPGDPAVAAAADAWGLGELGMRRLTEPLSCATSGRWKLLRQGRTELLYDLEADPLECAPIDPDTAIGPAAGGELRALRAALQRAAADPGTAVPAGQGGARPARPAEPDPRELAALRERMQVLGYL